MGHLRASSVQSGSGTVGPFLFPKMKEHLAGKHFANCEVLKDAAFIWLKNKAATLYKDGTHKLVSRYDKCLNVKGD